MSILEKIEKYRDRKFCLLLYPEDVTHMRALEEIKKSYDYACILHNKDLDENGNLKKEHYHVVVNAGKNAIWNTSFANNLGITANYIQRCRSLDRALEYLVHFNEPDKFQYNLDCVNGSLKSRLKANMNSVDKTEGEKVLQLIELIESYEYPLSVMEFSKKCAELGLWDVFRRSGVIFVKMIDEHNSRIYNELGINAGI